MPSTTTSSGDEEESIFAYACSVKSEEDTTKPNINVQVSSDVEDDSTKTKKEENNNALSVPPAKKESEQQNTECEIASAEEDEKEEEDSFVDYVESRDQFSRESCYGAIQEHLVRLEDRQKRLTNCMTPLSMIMAAEGDDDDYGTHGSVTPMPINGFGEALMQLQLLVEEMKDGFVLAMQELGRIQDWDRNLSARVENSEKNNQRMIGDLTHSVQQLKTDLNSALGEVRQNSEVTKGLSEQMQQFQNEHVKVLEEIKQQGIASQNERSKHKRKTKKPHSDSDNNNSDSGKPHSNGDSSKSDWEQMRNGKRVSPMMKPFMDSLPDAITGTMPPPCDSDSDSSATKAANHMLRMGNTLREKYQNQRQDAILGSSDSDDPQDVVVHPPDGKEGGTSTKKDFEGASPNEDKRLQIAQELLSSEKKYVSQLSFLKEKIVNPLIAEAQLSLSDINAMFPPCLNKLFQKHTSLLSTLESRLSHWKYQGMLGDIFARLTSADGGEFLQLYGKYIQNFSSCLAAMAKQTNKSSKLQTFLKNQLSEFSKEQSDLAVFLMAPIQRIPNYVICLKKLSKCTDSSHPDSFHLNNCLKQLTDFISTVNALVDDPSTPIRKLSSSSQVSIAEALALSKRRLSSKDSGLESVDEFGPNGSLATLQRTWQECLNTGKANRTGKSSSRTTSSTIRTEQKDSTVKKGRASTAADDKTIRKTRPKPKTRPKLDKRSQSVISPPPWGYDPQYMYNQQMGAYGPPPQPMLANGPAYIYGHPGPQMMPQDAHMSTGMYRKTGAGANVQYMLGRGFDARYYGQMHSANKELKTRRKSHPAHPDLDYLIFEEDEVGREASTETDDEASSYVPSTPSDTLSRKGKHGNEKDRRTPRNRIDRPPRSPVRDAPSSPPIYDQPTTTAPTSARSISPSSPTRTKPPMQRSLTVPLKDASTSPRDSLAKRKSTASIAPESSAPVLLTDVWNDGSPSEIDIFMDRRKSVQDNRKAVLQSLREMEERSARKPSITSSIKNMFRRRNLSEEAIPESMYESQPLSNSTCTCSCAHNTTQHYNQKVAGQLPVPPSENESVNVSILSNLEEIVDKSDIDLGILSSAGGLTKRRASAAAILNTTMPSDDNDENGDPCSAV